MMGRKKLSDLRKEVRAVFAKAGVDPGQVLDRMIRQLERRRKPDSREIESLLRLRDALAPKKAKRA